VNVEVAQAIELAQAQIEKRPAASPAPTRVRIYTKYSCN